MVKLGTLVLLSLSVFSSNLYATIVIDAGHGGKDPGCVNLPNHPNEIREKDISLNFAKKLSNRLSGSLLTRNEDEYLTLKERVEYANKLKADMFISIHVNSSLETPKDAGPEVWIYDASNLPHKELAVNIAKAMKSERGVKVSKRLYVLRKTKMPALLIELGFITDPEDVADMIDDSWQEEVALEISKQISSFQLSKK